MTIAPGRLTGTVSAPPSKSEQHRAVLLAALAGGTSRIHPVALSEDITATLNAARALGARWTLKADRLTLTGGARGDAKVPVIDCGESGSTLRFLVPIMLAAGAGARFVGRGRLGERPMEPYERLCKAQGIAYERRPGAALDLRVEGRLRPDRFELTGGVSSQFVSGLLMALPLLESESTVALTGAVESRPYIDMTTHVMRAFGVQVMAEGQVFKVPSAPYRACDYAIEGDYSQAAVFLCAAALGHDVGVSGLSPASKQADQAVLTHLMRMGARVSTARGVLRVASDGLTATEIDGSQCPDIVPMLALTAALASGTTRIVNAARLRLKESDRIRATCEVLTALGAKIQETADGMVIEGVGGFKGGVTLDCHGDHRIAMLLSVAALHADAPVTLTGVECLRKSYPEFMDVFQSLITR